MALTDRFEPAGQDVVAEEIEGEVVIVNLNNGNYYSLAQSGSLIWAGIQQRATMGELRDWLHQRYTGDAEVMELELERLVQALEEEDLIRRLPPHEAQPASAPPLPAEGQTTYQTPVFERFTDMGDLLLLDPVHETEEEKGWPHAKSSG